MKRTRIRSMFYFLTIVGLCLMTASGALAARPAKPNAAMPVIITEIKPIQPGCVQRYNPDPALRTLVIKGIAIPYPRSTENLQFRRGDTGAESAHFGNEVTWVSGTKVKIDMGLIHQLLWDDAKLTLQVRFTRYNPAFPKGQEPISDWSPPFYLANTIEACNMGLGDWQNLVSFRPAPAWQQNIVDRSDPNLSGLGTWEVQYIEDGAGYINLDYYSVRIDILPFKPNTYPMTRFTGPEFLTYVRQNISSFVVNPPGVGAAMFQLHDTRWNYNSPNRDIGPWASANPTGTAVSIELGNIGGHANYEYGAVLTSKYKNSPTHSFWRFSTIFTQRDAYHPVSGNREFGIKQEGISWVIYTRGVDRPSTWVYELGSLYLFDGGHQLWLSFQNKLAQFVNANFGLATVRPEFSQRYNWVDICRGYWYPTRPWIDQPIVRDETKCR